MKVTFPDGSSKEYEPGTTPLDIAKGISEGLARSIIAARVNEQLVDVTRPINEDATLTLIKPEDDVELLRHSCAHLLAHAVKRLYPEAKPTIGPPVEHGFYYDFADLSITNEELPRIEQEMRKIAKEKHEIRRIEHKDKDEAIEAYENPYKKEMIRELDEGTSSYVQGDFKDLCRGPHVPNTGIFQKVGFTLDKIAGAYWRGDEKNPMLTRIYGLCFATKQELDEFLERRAEAEKRDHKRLGLELGLYVHSDIVGRGLPLLTPKGATIKRELFRFIQDEELRRGYEYTETPVLAKTELYKVSGHIDHYREGMFIFTTREEEMALRPMTCPHQFMIYKARTWSYRDMPVRYAEIASLFRNELSGELHGLIRVRQFTLADAHIFCRPDQLEEEFEGVVDLVQYVMRTLGFTDYWYRFSKWDPAAAGKKYIDKPKRWEESQAALKRILDKLQLEYVEAEDEAAFYGPKLDIQMRNVYGKEDTIFTVQIDFAMPERFDMTYTDERNEAVRPLIIHRSSIGCLERTMAMLIEHHAGKFPLWLSPEQARVITIADRHESYARDVVAGLREAGLRVTLDARGETTKKKVREAQLDYVNYILVVGDKEVADSTVSVRTRDGTVHGAKKWKEVCNELVNERDERA